MRVAILSSLVAVSAGTAVPWSNVLIGGGETGQPLIDMFNTIVELGGGPGKARFCVIGAASNDPPSEIAYYGQLLLNAGAASYYAVPVNINATANNSNPTVVAAVSTCTGAFLGGGDQMLIIESFFLAGHVQSPVLMALLAAVAAARGVIAGTSAGAESQTSRVVIGGGNSYLALLNGAHAWVPGDPDDDTPGNLTDYAPGGLGVFPWGLVDAHFADRGRQGRQLRLAADTQAVPVTGSAIGFGIDQNTALVVQAGVGRVIGARGVLVTDVSGAVVGGSMGPGGGPGQFWSIANASLTYLTAGDTIDMETLSVTPAPWKRPLTGRQHDAHATSSLDVFAEGTYAFEAVATSLVNCRLDSSAWGSTAESAPRFNLTFSLAPGTAGYDGTAPPGEGGAYAISYTRLRLDVGATTTTAGW